MYKHICGDDDTSDAETAPVLWAFLICDRRLTKIARQCKTNTIYMYAYMYAYISVYICMCIYTSRSIRINWTAPSPVSKIFSNDIFTRNYTVSNPKFYFFTSNIHGVGWHQL